MHIGLAQYDRARAEQSLDDRRVVPGAVLSQRRRAGGVGQAGNLDIVLDHDRHAVKRPARSRGRQCPVGVARRRKDRRGVDRDEGVEIPSRRAAIEQGGSIFDG